MAYFAPVKVFDVCKAWFVRHLLTRFFGLCASLISIVSEDASRQNLCYNEVQKIILIVSKDILV